MCGIAGMFDKESSPAGGLATFYEMQNTLRRRGPDQKGLYIDEPAVLIHTRLSVVDIENGKQPMQLVMGGEEYCIVYNGELYNTLELKKELESAGHIFFSHSDTEVLLHSYAEWKDKCVDKLNGIFAFAVWEKHNKRLFVARDRIGVKPFFYYEKNGKFIFASEIKALLAHPHVDAVIDAESIAEIMYIGPGRTPGCGVFRGIQELKPAHCGYFDGANGLSARRYWRPLDKEHTDSFAQTVEKVRFLVVDSIERQLVSDVPVCTFLSGGLDSGIISSVANAYFAKQGKNLKTFSVDYKDNEKYFRSNKFQPDNDREYIDCMTEYLGAENRRVLLDTDELTDALFDAVDARDLPGMADVDSSLLLFCKEIKKHATVALSGECADEIFGGYPWYRDREIRMRSGFPWAQSTAYRSGFLHDGFALKNDAYEYVNSRYTASIGGASVMPNADADERRMKEMIHINLEWFMQTLLDRKDRMSMYGGLEVRVPFCDYRIAEYLYTVPWEMKDYGGREKGLLREAAKGLLPEKVLWRKKSPYPKTHNPAYLAAVSKRLTRVINDKNQPLLGIVKKDALESLLKNADTVPWYGQLMTAPQTIAYFLQINYWLTKHKERLAF
ncbi:MAG: asparagine synthase (glutamine-hydrolyzing) [Clostridiales bacterium]|jgi:asparagine synthase (glutamine-hydrolysing)|nr:asparagine synthase (glutamine-hydrolyzing) [Clostridiales bacterium]